MRLLPPRAVGRGLVVWCFVCCVRALYRMVRHWGFCGAGWRSRTPALLRHRSFTHRCLRRRQHQTLLEAVLPKEVIRELRKEDTTTMEARILQAGA